MSLPKFKIVVDTREKNPWKFVRDEHCDGYTIATVKHGDYTIEGMEGVAFIERKACPTEIAGNLVSKRFANLINKVENYKYKYLICEFPISAIQNYPYGCGLPKSVIRKIRVTANFLMSKMLDLAMEHDIHVVFCDNPAAAQKFAKALLKKIYLKESNASN